MAADVQSKPHVEPLKLGSLKPRRKGLRALLSTQGARRLVQLGFAGFIALTAYQHVLAEAAGQVTASPEAFCPFGGLESLYRYVTSGGKFVPHTHLSNMVLAVAVLLTAFLARSAFCGWVCPLGFLQDAASGPSGFLRRRVSPFGRFVSSAKARGARLAALDGPLRLLKYAVLVWSISGAAIYGVMVFRDYDPWAALLTITELSVIPGLVVLALLLVGSIFVERPWCRYACPLGAVSGLLGRFSPVYLQREASTCRNCAACSRSCPMGLSIHNVATVRSPDCMGCMECVDSCPVKNSLEVKVGLPGMGK